MWETIGFNLKGTFLKMVIFSIFKLLFYITAIFGTSPAKGISCNIKEPFSKRLTFICQFRDIRGSFPWLLKKRIEKGLFEVIDLLVLFHLELLWTKNVEKFVTKGVQQVDIENPTWSPLPWKQYYTVV